jgi:DMSO/TMAO reductase YedYZ molybdopterin-dependent catalytic subunit
MPSRTQITRHDCVEGWSAIAKWTGVPLARVLDLARPLPAARFVVFHCADPMDGSDQAAPGSTYYESLDLDEARHPQTILAYAVNDAPLPVQNGAPLRLRVERQLGYKHAKYLMRIELVERLDNIRGGKGGYWEDLGYEWYAGI